MKNNLTKSVRIPPRHMPGPETTRSRNGYDYVFYEDIEAYHGKAWAKRWAKAAGRNTGYIVDGRLGIYYHDYTRFAELLETGKPTYWD